jgi:hypothetical protein
MLGWAFTVRWKEVIVGGGWSLMVNGEEHEVSDLDDLRCRLVRVRALNFAETWLSHTDERALAMLANGPHAWLIYLRENGDAGFSSRNRAYDGDPKSAIEYRLGNGQVDRYPAAWDVSREVALEALECLFVHGERAPWIDWHDDSDPDGPIWTG